MDSRKSYFANLKVPDDKRIKIDMDYKEKYEEAYKLYHSEETTKDQRYVLERLFPELKESEDEKMMNQLHSWMKEFGGAEEYTEKVYNWLQGLIEKQGEQKPSTDFSDIRTWKYIVDAVLTEKEGIGQYLDSPFTEEVAKKLQKRFGNIEQKPAWSKDDENGFGDTLWAIQQARTIAKDENDMGNLWYAERWLKSLKERYTWKPSDEQMYNLSEAAHYRTVFWDCGILIGLYDELKKLKG